MNERSSKCSLLNASSSHITQKHYNSIEHSIRATYVFKARNLIITTGTISRSKTEKVAQGKLFFLHLRTSKLLLVVELHIEPIKCLLVEPQRGLIISSCKANHIKFTQFKGRNFRSIRHVVCPYTICSLFFVEPRNVLVLCTTAKGKVHFIRLGVWEIEVLLQSNSEDMFYRADYSKTYDILALLNPAFVLLIKLDKYQKAQKIGKMELATFGWCLNFLPIGRSEYLFVGGSENKVYYTFIGSNIPELENKFDLFVNPNSSRNFELLNQEHAKLAGMFQFGCIHRYEKEIFLLCSNTISTAKLVQEDVLLKAVWGPLIELNYKQSTKELVALQSYYRVFLHPCSGHLTVIRF